MFLERMAATGGRAVKDIFGNSPKVDWDKLVGRFLHTEVKQGLLFFYLI